VIGNEWAADLAPFERQRRQMILAGEATEMAPSPIQAKVAYYVIT
jgi:hypothetical protein